MARSDNQAPGSKDSQCASLNLTSSARKAKRKLMFTGDVLRGHKFYLHLKSTNLDQKALEKDIVHLGGVVEKFLSKDISRVVVPSTKFLLKTGTLRGFTSGRYISLEIGSYPRDGLIPTVPKPRK